MSEKDFLFLTVHYGDDLEGASKIEKKFDIAFSVNLRAYYHDEPEPLNPKFEGLWYTPDFDGDKSHILFRGLETKGDFVEKFRFVFDKFFRDQIVEEWENSGKIPEIAIIGAVLA